MKQYIIDGNNLIGKIPSLKSVQKKDKQGSREKLAFMIDNYFNQKNAKVFLHFDGYPKESIRINNASVVYSENLTADDAANLDTSIIDKRIRSKTSNLNNVKAKKIINEFKLNTDFRTKKNHVSIFIFERLG